MKPLRALSNSIIAMAVVFLVASTMIAALARPIVRPFTESVLGRIVFRNVVAPIDTLFGGGNYTTSRDGEHHEGTYFWLEDEKVIYVYPEPPPAGWEIRPPALLGRDRVTSRDTFVAARIVCEYWRRSGLWAITREWRAVDISFHPIIGELTPERIHDVRTHLLSVATVDALDLRPDEVQSLRMGPIIQERVLWRGYLTNAATVVLLAVVGMSFVRGTILVRRALHARARVRRSLCAHCSYPRSGLDGDAPCPECGSVPPR